MEITASTKDINVKLEDQTILGQEVVVSASRVEESVMRAPVTIEKMDILAIQQAPTADFFDAVARLKGVQSTSSSMTFNAINTRGFATIANVRFVQLVDGMDTSAPLLNFPTGNIVGMSELDIESFELVPGAASALYGPNAFNGIMLMNGKNPFEYQGLSAQAKVGVTQSNTAGPNATAHGSNPYFNAAIRYAKAFNNKFAFKVNFSYLKAEDWRANDYTSFRTTAPNFGRTDNPTLGSPNFDGMNLYGDETNIPFLGLPAASQGALVGGISQQLAPLFAPAFGGNTAQAQAAIAARLPSLFAPLSLNRTGFREEDLVDNFDAKTIKGDLGLYYRINDRLELSYNYRIGAGSSVYQGAERYALRDFSIQFHRLQLKGNNFFVRAYMTQTDDGDSYNLAAMGGFVNERLRATGTQWLPTYLGTYAGALLQQPGVLAGGVPNAQQIAGAHGAARTAANNGIPAVGSAQFNTIVEQVRKDLFKRNPAGAGFVDNSRLFHAEFNYNLTSALKEAIELQVGGNVRRYDLFSDGTVFNEDPDGDGKNERITIDEFGAYVQAAKSLADDRLKITASVRFDKNENFEGQFSPRASIVYSAGETKQHNFRASFQRGFRNPDTQAQFIYFPSSAGNLLGSAERNAAPFGIHNGGAWSLASVRQFIGSGGTNPALLQTVNLRYVQPEVVRVVEVGYKGLFGKNFMVDANFYYNSYKDFIAGQTVAAKAAGSVGTITWGQFGLFRPAVNADVPVKSWGVGLGINYKFYKGFIFNGNYSWADYDADLAAGSEFEVGFNTPRNKFTIGVNNREVVKNLGFDISYRWQQEFKWESSFAHAIIPTFGVIDAQINYKVKSIKSMFKLGASNLFGKDYITNGGGPWVGKMYYIGITFDEFLR
jgi:outer membrane receptor protein involved in Fe transport